jgi:branched-chain amino acid transport system permease protein
VLSGLPLIDSIIAALATGAICGWAIDRIAYRPLYNRRESAAWGFRFGPFISTLGVAGILQGLARGFFGVDRRNFPIDSLPTEQLRIGTLELPLLQAAMLIASVATLAGLWVLLQRTHFGRSVRAIAENRDMVELVGVNTGAVLAGLWTLSGLLAALAGVFAGMVFGAISPVMGLSYEIKGFVVVILGGLGSVPGALIASYLLAAMETVAVVFVSSELRDVVAFGVLLAFLVWRPSGLLGKRGRLA